MIDILTLVRPNVLKFTPYVAARDGFSGKDPVLLDSNEYPVEWGYNRYPDPQQMELKKIISRIKNVPVENIFVGNGSDEAIDMLFRVFCEPKIDNTVACYPSYSMYCDAALMNDVECRQVALSDDFSISVDRILGATDEHTKLIFICSPNNPTGNLVPKEDIIALAERFDGVLVVDEAYIDFTNSLSTISLLDSYPNIIVLQTLSKAWGMAGLRIGLAYGRADIIRLINGFKYPYNVSGASLDIAIKMMKDKSAPDIEEIISERRRVSDTLKEIGGVEKVYPSKTNFILFKCRDAERLFVALRSKGVIVRDRYKVPGCENCLRVSIGLIGENDIFLNEVKKFYSL